MAKAADQFTATDVTVWGIVALACWAFAVLATNLSGVIPSSVLGALHASRLDGGTLNQLRGQVAALETEAARMKRENAQLVQRFALNEEASGVVTRRVGALEISLPILLEAQATPRAVDPAITGSIGDGKTVTFEAEGGSVAVRQQPLLPGGGIADVETQPLPQVIAEIAPATGAIGVALGFPVAEAGAEAEWQSLQAKVGTLLIGLAPLLMPVDGFDGRQIVAGPLRDQAEAAALCDRLARVGIPCRPAGFGGEPVRLNN